MIKRIIPYVVVVVFVVAVTGCGKVVVGVNHAPPATPIVQVAEATGAQSSSIIDSVATLEGATSREIHSSVSGYLVKQAYQDGALVREGDLLFEIDTNPEHTQPGTTTAYTKITSPIAGVAAHAERGLGDLVNPSMTLTTVSAVEMVVANFALPERVYRDHEAWSRKVLEEPVAARPEDVRLLLEDGTIYPTMGRLSVIEPLTPSPLTPNSFASAIFSNPDHVLKPGQYAKVRITIDTNSNTVLIPQRCVTRLQDIDQVTVVKPDNTVEIRRVTLGDMSGSSWIITAGLATGERVVVDGIERCVPGATVTPQPYVEPTPEPPTTNAPPQ